MNAHNGLPGDQADGEAPLENEEAAAAAEAEAVALEAEAVAAAAREAAAAAAAREAVAAERRKAAHVSHLTQLAHAAECSGSASARPNGSRSDRAGNSHPSPLASRISAEQAAAEWHCMQLRASSYSSPSSKAPSPRATAPALAITAARNAAATAAPAPSAAASPQSTADMIAGGGAGGGVGSAVDSPTAGVDSPPAFATATSANSSHTGMYSAPVSPASVYPSPYQPSHRWGAPLVSPSTHSASTHSSIEPSPSHRGPGGSNAGASGGSFGSASGRRSGGGSHRHSISSQRSSRQASQQASPLPEGDEEAEEEDGEGTKAAEAVDVAEEAKEAKEADGEHMRPTPPSGVPLPVGSPPRRLIIHASSPKGRTPPHPIANGHRSGTALAEGAEGDPALKHLSAAPMCQAPPPVSVSDGDDSTASSVAPTPPPPPQQQQQHVEQQQPRDGSLAVEVAEAAEPAEAASMAGVESWPPSRVGEWLRAIGLPQHAPRFVEQSIDGASLRMLSRDDLDALGVHLVGHRLLILRSVGALESGGGAPAPSHAGMTAVRELRFAEDGMEGAEAEPEKEIVQAAEPEAAEEMVENGLDSSRLSVVGTELSADREDWED